ncbi:MAG TPA: hypothetical protein PKZ24_01530, partial [Nitrospirales bacterium]|nr:hypothetical protein [Nitrospirales bacterium]
PLQLQRLPPRNKDRIARSSVYCSLLTFRQTNTFDLLGVMPNSLSNKYLSRSPYQTGVSQLE